MRDLQTGGDVRPAGRGVLGSAQPRREACLHWRVITPTSTPQPAETRAAMSRFSRRLVDGPVRPLQSYSHHDCHPDQDAECARAHGYDQPGTQCESREASEERPPQVAGSMCLQRLTSVAMVMAPPSMTRTAGIDSGKAHVRNGAAIIPTPSPTLPCTTEPLSTDNAATISEAVGSIIRPLLAVVGRTPRPAERTDVPPAPAPETVWRRIL